MPRPTLSMRARMQLQFRLRRHRQPVAGPDVGAEHHDAARRHAVEQSRAGGKAGKAEERRGRIAAPLAVEREFVGLDAAIDLGLGLGRAAGGRAADAKTCDGRCEWPSASSRRASCGWASALRPTRKKVACTHSAFSASSTFGVVVGQGPSSKVSTSSFGASGSVCGNSLRPTARRGRGIDRRARARCRAHPDCPGSWRGGRPAAAARRRGQRRWQARSNHRRAVYALIVCPACRREATSGAHSAPSHRQEPAWPNEKSERCRATTTAPSASAISARVVKAIETGRRRDAAPAGRRSARSRSRRRARGARAGAAAAPGRTARHRFRFHRAHRSGRRGARGNPRRTAAAHGRRRRARHRIRRRGDHPRRSAARTSRPKSSNNCRRPSASRCARSLDYPEDSAGRRMQTEFIAVPPGWNVGAGDRLYARDRRTAGAVLRALRRRTRPAASSAPCRSTGCCAASGRCRSPN